MLSGGVLLNCLSEQIQSGRESLSHLQRYDTTTRHSLRLHLSGRTSTSHPPGSTTGTYYYVEQVVLDHCH